MEDISTMQEQQQQQQQQQQQRRLAWSRVCKHRQTTPSSSKSSPGRCPARDSRAGQLPGPSNGSPRAASAQATTPSPELLLPKPRYSPLGLDFPGRPGPCPLGHRAKRLRGNLQVKLRYLSTRRSVSLRRQGVAVPRRDFAGTGACSS